MKKSPVGVKNDGWDLGPSDSMGFVLSIPRYNSSNNTRVRINLMIVLGGKNGTAWISVDYKIQI